jgi:rod shape-determining protein MreD
MRGITYIILAYLAIGLQVGLGPYLTVQSAKPDLVLLAVVFLAINARREAALLGAFGMGLLTDMVALAPIGMYAFSYSLAAMFVVSTQEVVYREHPLTHLTLGLVGAVLVAGVELVHGMIHRTGSGPAILLTSALYTAALAPLVLGVMQRLRRLLRLQAGGRIRRPQEQLRRAA